MIVTRAGQNVSVSSLSRLPGDCLNPTTRQWWAAVDSNHLPPRYQHGALPVELAALGLEIPS